MKVIHINFDGEEVGGASIAMCRMHRQMLAEGIDSVILCRHRANAPGATVVPYGVLYGTIRLVTKAVARLLTGRGDTAGLVPTGFYKRINSENPDLVILHWVQGETIGISELLKIKAPVAWYHHDLWPIRGVTAYEWFKVPNRSKFLDKLAKWNKRRIAQRLGTRLTPMCASLWVANQIRSSGIYSVEPQIRPLPISPVFKPGKRTPHEKFRILNGARGGFDCGIKGGDRLLEALKLIPDDVKTNIELIVFGTKDKDSVVDGVPVRYLGRLCGEELAQVYRDADVFAFPSRQETFGQTKLESIACGTPVVAFDETACAEGIKHKITGWIAQPNDIRGFADGILYFYNKYVTA